MAARFETAPLAPPDVRETARMLARAFRDNPLNCAVIRAGEAQRLRANVATMDLLVPIALRHGEAWVARADSRPVAAFLAARPGRYPLPPPSLAARLAALWRMGFHVASLWLYVFVFL
jgi:hypothetical protein